MLYVKKNTPWELVYEETNQNLVNKIKTKLGFVKEGSSIWHQDRYKHYLARHRGNLSSLKFDQVYSRWIEGAEYFVGVRKTYSASYVGLNVYRAGNPEPLRNPSLAEKINLHALAAGLDPSESPGRFRIPSLSFVLDTFRSEAGFEISEGVFPQNLTTFDYLMSDLYISEVTYEEYARANTKTFAEFLPQGSTIFTTEELGIPTQPKGTDNNLSL